MTMHCIRRNARTCKLSATLLLRRLIDEGLKQGIVLIIADKNDLYTIFILFDRSLMPCLFFLPYNCSRKEGGKP
jgi:hypothetical protein